MVLDATSWDLIEEALHTSDLKSEASRLAAISAIVNSRKLLSDADIARSQELAQRLGWETSHGDGETLADLLSDMRQHMQHNWVADAEKIEDWYWEVASLLGQPR
mgnify:FL=1